jgi:hypothetical protein
MRPNSVGCFSLPQVSLGRTLTGTILSPRNKECPLARFGGLCNREGRFPNNPHCGTGFAALQDTPIAGTRISSEPRTSGALRLKVVRFSPVKWSERRCAFAFGHSLIVRAEMKTTLGLGGFELCEPPQQFRWSSVFSS